MATDAAPILHLYDTFRGEKRPLTLLEPGKCGVYTCGPTVYDMSHIGHGRAALAPDVLVRFLRHQGIEVTYVRNVTDIDDKIIARAGERNCCTYRAGICGTRDGMARSWWFSGPDRNAGPR